MTTTSITNEEHGVRKRPMSKESSMSVFTTFVVTRNGKVDASGILSRKCFEHWIACRKNKVEQPEKSFQRAVIAHLAAKNGRRPFEPEVEASLLECVRQQKRWPCFQNSEAPKVGQNGFRGVGYHEALALQGNSKPQHETNPRTMIQREVRTPSEDGATTLVHIGEDGKPCSSISPTFTQRKRKRQTPQDIESLSKTTRTIHTAMDSWCPMPLEPNCYVPPSEANDTFHQVRTHSGHICGANNGGGHHQGNFTCGPARASVPWSQSAQQVVSANLLPHTASVSRGTAAPYGNSQQHQVRQSMGYSNHPEYFEQVRDPSTTFEYSQNEESPPYSARNFPMASRNSETSSRNILDESSLSLVEQESESENGAVFFPSTSFIRYASRKCIEACQRVVSRPPRGRGANQAFTAIFSYLKFAVFMVCPWYRPANNAEIQELAAIALQRHGKHGGLVLSDFLFDAGTSEKGVVYENSNSVEMLGESKKPSNSRLIASRCVMSHVKASVNLYMSGDAFTTVDSVVHDKDMNEIPVVMHIGIHPVKRSLTYTWFMPSPSFNDQSEGSNSFTDAVSEGTTSEF